MRSLLTGAAALLIAGCVPSATATQVRKATDGGTILVSGGSGAPAAWRNAVSVIERHCKGMYEVVELAQVETGRTQSMGIAAGFGPVAVGTSGSSPVFGTSVTYVCRPPGDTELNEQVLALATEDIVGRRCAADQDCGPLFCVRATPAAATGNCARGDARGTQ
jgi:hypothetical protein